MRIDRPIIRQLTDDLGRRQMKSGKSFEERGEKILHYLRSDLRHDLEKIPRPIVVEITGTPDAGKTTTIKELDNSFRKIGFRVICPQEGAEEIRHIPRTTPLYNIRTGLYALQKLIDYTAGHMYDLVIFDRGIFDPYCWMMYWQEKDKLTEEERILLQQFFLLRFWVDKVDAVWFVVCDAEEALRRNQRIALTTRLGETTNPQTIKILIDRYLSAYNQLKPQFPQLNLLDTTKLDEKTMIETVTSRTMDILEQNMKSKTTR